VGKLCGLFFKRVEALHQAALAAGGIVFMDGAFFRSRIQGTDRQQSRLAGGFLIAVLNGRTSFSYESAGAANKETIANTSLLILPVALDLGLNISQLIPPKFGRTLPRHDILLEGIRFVQRFPTKISIFAIYVLHKTGKFITSMPN
jgi:hypothetical protein